MLGHHRAWAHRAVAAGDLPTVRIGGRTYVVTARLLDEVLGLRAQTAPTNGNGAADLRERDGGRSGPTTREGPNP